jgi:pilus assembly protein CpaD
MKITSLISRSGTLGLVCLAAFTLAGCVTDDAAMDDTRSVTPYAGSSAFPITVAKGPITLEVSSKSGTLGPQQVNAVQGFVNQAASAGVTPITVSRPSGGGASARVAGEIANLIAQQGIARNMIRITTHSASSTSPVVLSYVSTYAQTKKCGEWPNDMSESMMNEHNVNHGCAVQANIAAMVADPNSLIVPTPVDPIRAAGRVKAIKTLEAPAQNSRSSWFSFY